MMATKMSMIIIVNSNNYHCELFTTYNILNTLHGGFTRSSQVSTVIISNFQMRKLRGGVIYPNFMAS